MRNSTNQRNYLPGLALGAGADRWGPALLPVLGRLEGCPGTGATCRARTWSFYIFYPSAAATKPLKAGCRPIGASKSGCSAISLRSRATRSRQEGRLARFRHFGNAVF